MHLSGFERRWAQPSSVPSSPARRAASCRTASPTWISTAFLDETSRRSRSSRRSGCASRFWVIALAPLFMLGKLATIAGSPRRSREAAPVGLRRASLPIRSTLVALKACRRSSYCGDARLRPLILAMTSERAEHVKLMPLRSPRRNPARTSQSLDQPSNDADEEDLPTRAQPLRTRTSPKARRRRRALARAVDEPFDFVVVGSGAAGAVAAHVLATAGSRRIVEEGPWVKTREFKDDVLGTFNKMLRALRGTQVLKGRPSCRCCKGDASAAAPSSTRRSPGASPEDVTLDWRDRFGVDFGMKASSPTSRCSSATSASAKCGRDPRREQPALHRDLQEARLRGEADAPLRQRVHGQRACASPAARRRRSRG